jgi:acetyl esterase/lipase
MCAQRFQAAPRFLPLALLLSIAASAQEPALRKLADIPYATVAGRDLLLDLYLPEGAASPPLIVYVHGGAWRSGSKNSMPLGGLVAGGFAVASVDYRLSPEARFPAQIHDIKAAIRFLRAEHETYGFDASRLAIAGSSAGAHLAALVGMTGGDAGLEGAVGEHLDQSCEVQAIVSYFGAGNLLTILEQSTPHGLSVRAPALQLLLGGLPEELPEVARVASPVFHVDPTDPPLLLLHGDQDPQMPVSQSLELLGAYEELGLPVELEIVHGAAHGGKLFHDPERTRLVVRFLQARLGPS